LAVVVGGVGGKRLAGILANFKWASSKSYLETFGMRLKEMFIAETSSSRA